MTFAARAKKTAIATAAAAALVAAGATLAPSNAHAGNNVAGALIGGAIIGGLIGIAASKQRYHQPVYRTCYTQWETRYNAYGQPYSVQVRYC